MEHDNQGDALVSKLPQDLIWTPKGRFVAVYTLTDSAPFSSGSTLPAVNGIPVVGFDKSGHAWVLSPAGREGRVPGTLVLAGHVDVIGDMLAALTYVTDNG